MKLPKKLAGVAGFEPAPTVLETISIKRSLIGRFLFEVIFMCSMETIQYGAVRHMMKESISKPNGITLARAYEIAINYMQNQDAAIELLTSDKCKFTKNEVNDMLYQKNYQKKYYQKQKSKALNHASAF